MIKRRLVVLDASPRATVRLRLARAPAVAHEGEVTALYGVLPTSLATPWAAGEGMASAAASLMAEVDEGQRRRAHAVSQEAGAADRLRWLDGGDSPYRALLQQSFMHDLLVLGQFDATDAETCALPADLVPAASGGLELLHAENLRRHKARTLWARSDAMEVQLVHARGLTSEATVRAHRSYSAGSATCFERGRPSQYQLLPARPDARIPRWQSWATRSDYPFRRGRMVA